jgi:hypothetical protein
MATNLSFIDWHKPGLEPGDYRITVEQSVKADGRISSESFSVTRQFSVLGPRFNLDPQEVQNMFPPPGSLGEHSNVLPHIILKRSTLPWERQADPGSDREKVTPWLALLLFEEQEIDAPRTLTLRDLFSSQQPLLAREKGDHDDDQITVIDVPKSLLQQIIPTTEELTYLAHVRQNGKEETAVIIGNRLPKPGALSVVHLVSVEHRFTADQFNYQGAKPTDLIRLVSLKSWRFACVSAEHSFRGLLTHLNHQLLPQFPDQAALPSTLRLPPLKGTDGTVNTAAEAYFKRGCVPLPHSLLQGNQTVSWYHGPLTPGRNKSKDIDLPIRSADELVRYNQDDGTFDVSYATAWELGRLLTLQKTGVAVDLFNWKRAHAHEEQLRTAERFLAHLPYEKPETDLELPETVTKWFADLARLHGVPFSYLVPDERLLPPESIRFFWVDWRWVECLLDGAFSVGRAMPIDHERDQKHAASTAKTLVQTPHESVTGLLLRSAVVAGWPGLLVDGYNHETNETKSPLRMERLSKNVLLCLFSGEVTAVDIHQKPETLHFGFNSPDYSNLDYSKENKGKKVAIVWRDRDKRVVDTSKLAISLGGLTSTPKDPYHSAKFAIDMIEGVECVRFQLA